MKIPALLLLLFCLVPWAFAEEPKWYSLLQFEGEEQTMETLKNWEVIPYGGPDVDGPFITNGVLQIPMGIELSGLRYTGELPTNHYEVALDAKRIDGGDFFCGLTFPVGTNSCTLIGGGWGGGLLGISSLDNLDASENETTDYLNFQEDKWYAFRLQVTPTHFRVWVDKDLRIDVEIGDRQPGMRSGAIEASMPFGLSTWMTSAQIKNLRIRDLPVPGAKASAEAPAGPDFGDSKSTTLTGKAWGALAETPAEAVVFAKKCVDLYEKDALKMQAGLKDFVVDDGTNAIAELWALNDVGTSYFIMGKALEKQGKKKDAIAAYTTLKTTLGFAQCWDPEGWFWKPAAAATERLAELKAE